MFAYAGNAEQVVIGCVKNGGKRAETVYKRVRKVVCVLLRNCIIEQKLKNFVGLKAVKPFREETLLYMFSVILVHNKPPYVR